MRDRLIEIINNCAKQPIMIEGLEHWSDTIADYLLENGVIVPPCKVGDTVWYIDTNYNIQKAEVTCIDIRSTSKSLIATRYVWETEETVKLALMFEHLNEGYCLTKEQAEKALAEVANGT